VGGSEASGFTTSWCRSGKGSEELIGCCLADRIFWDNSPWASPHLQPWEVVHLLVVLQASVDLSIVGNDFRGWLWYGLMSVEMGLYGLPCGETYIYSI